MDTKELPTAVHKGAALLDDRVPGWYDRINLGTLDMENVLHCVLGQLGRPHDTKHGIYGGYNTMLVILQPTMEADVSDYGFDLEDDSEHWGFGITDDDWETLDILWRGEITMRRERDNGRA